VKEGTSARQSAELVRRSMRRWLHKKNPDSAGFMFTCLRVVGKSEQVRSRRQTRGGRMLDGVIAGASELGRLGQPGS